MSWGWCRRAARVTQTIPGTNGQGGESKEDRRPHERNVRGPGSVGWLDCNHGRCPLFWRAEQWRKGEFEILSLVEDGVEDGGFPREI